MSGICAVWHKHNHHWTASAIVGMTNGLSLHALESRDHKTAGTAGIGVSARFATQQIFESASVVIACDAELYNQDALYSFVAQQELPKPATTAALLAILYERLGSVFVEKLVGAFAVLLWDKRDLKLIAAIDGFGIKRLVSYRDGESVLLSSRVDAIASAQLVNLTVNPRAITNILNFTADLAPDTIFEQIQRLSPGTVLTISNGDVRVEKYWDIRYCADGEKSERELSRELHERFEASVTLHCKRDPFDSLGAFLSGGTDSSTVVGMMSRMRQGPVKAFSIGFQEQPFNELEYARLAATTFGADHYTYLVGADDCFNALPDIVRYFDEPFGNSSAIPTYFCARLAAESGVTTLLAGDGGDELFGGNERYRIDKLFSIYHSAPEVLRKGLLEPFLAHVPIRNGLIGKARGYVRRANMSGIERMLSFQFLSMHRPVDVFTSTFAERLGRQSFLDIPSRHYAEAAASHPLDRLLYVDMKITLADNDLPKVTCMSELAGLQVRFPYLHRPVAEFSGHIPARLKVKGFEKRYLFKQAFRNLLPKEIIQKKKHGFGIPVALWMKSDRRLQELSRDTLLSARTFDRGYFRRDFIENLFQKYESDESTYYGDTIWTFLMLELWHRQVVDRAAKVAV